MRACWIMVLTVLAGCVAPGPPDWVRVPPEDERYIYAVGEAGVTQDRNPASSTRLARERAIEGLAEYRGVRVQVQIDAWDTSSGSKIRIDSQHDIDEFVEGIEVVATWVDENPPGPGRYRTFVLVRMRRDLADRFRGG